MILTRLVLTPQTKTNLHWYNIRGLQTCRWTVQVGHATSFIRLPDPSDLEPKKEKRSILVASKTYHVGPVLDSCITQNLDAGLTGNCFHK